MFIKRILDNEKNSRIKIIGVGNLGNSIIDKFYKKNLEYHTIVITPNEGDGFGIPDTKLILGYNTNRGLPIVSDEETAQAIFEESKNEIESILRNHSEYSSNDNIIITGGIGDNLSNVIIPEILKLNNKIANKNRKVFVIVSTPFKFEGTQKNNNSKIYLNKLEEMKNNNIIDKLVIINSDEYNKHSGVRENYDIVIEKECDEVYNIINTL